MKMLNNLSIKIWSYILVSVVSASSAFAANSDEFSEAANVVSTASKSGMNVFGTIMIWFFAVFLPIGCILGGILLGYKQRNKQAERDKNSIKICTIFVYGFVGFFVFVVVTACLSQVIFGDMTFLFGVILDFIKDIAVDIVDKIDVRH